ncbi:hypothetical protein INR49_025440 [Caranx melampygus]|nr:hypothetical protein INR49_025440 [Caranx melampygus]
MDEYQHPLFFEARDLTAREQEKVRRHFQKKRDSGGGECGIIEKTGGNTYKICFKEKDEQERVLQRKFHTISLPSGELQLTVSRTSSPDTQTQTFTKTNRKTLEKIFKMDVYLLFYLRDNIKVNKLLQKQLSWIGCTLRLNFDEEEAVVQGDIEKGQGGAFSAAEDWEMQVDRVFINLTEDYLSYHVLEPKQIKMLQQDSSFETDDIKVYSEIGYSVVVGETKAVKAKIAILEKSVPSRKELPIIMKQFKLIEEEFNQEMRAHYPEVKFLISNNMIIMEGPDDGVQSGATKHDELVKNIKEKKVKLPTELISFIKSSGAVSKYEARFQQSLRNPVALEAGSELVLSSLSSGALDEAWAAVQRDLSVDTVKLQSNADLDRVKEVLNKAKSGANCRELKVDVRFIPGISGSSETKVRIVGYTENVNKLKDVLNDYQMNQVEVEEAVNYRILNWLTVLIKSWEAKQALTSILASLTIDKLVLDGPGAQRYFQKEGKVNKDLVESSCQVLIRELPDTSSTGVTTRTPNISLSSPSLRATPRMYGNPVRTIAVNKTSLKIKVGSLEDEQVNVLVAPMLNKQLNSTNIGIGLLRKGGSIIQSNFNSAAANSTVTPGGVLQVTGPPSLGCSKLFFIECLPWDGPRGQSVQALCDGLKKCLDLCAQQGMTSVAFPVIGPGIKFKYPLKEAIELLAESIHNFGQSASTGSLNTIHVVVKPGYPDSEECFHDVYRQLSSIMNPGGQVIFSSLTTDLDDITMTVGPGIKLQLVFGDITNETTDAIVNTTDFVNFHNAGPGVEAQLKTAKVQRGEVFKTNAGSFPSKAILHVCGERDEGVTEQVVSRIIQVCESSGYKSVAIPAISAGAGGLDPGVVAGAIIRGVKAATSSTPFYYLTDIRLVLIKINVFLEFKEEAMQQYPTPSVNTVPMPLLPHVYQEEPPRSLTADISNLQNTFTNQTSTFLFLGLSRQDVSNAKTKLKGVYETQCATQILPKEQLEGLTEDDMTDLTQLVESKGLYIQTDQSSPNTLTVSGLKDGVNEVMQIINRSRVGSLMQQVRLKEEDDVYTRVAWCILGPNGNWERLPKTANHNLENRDIGGGIIDAQSIRWIVDLQKMVAKRQRSTQEAQLKRLQNLEDFTLPLYWDPMATRENVKVVLLQPSSAEYRAVKEGFRRTVTKTVTKIERLQNIHLRRGYEVQKKQISDKNTNNGAGEKLLYHGTTQANCDSIMKTGFNRSFAGQNATAYGHGTYFAVNASYSAHTTYSKPAADGTQLMFVARVLTGLYTQGQSGMKVPPPLNDQQPHDRYDSVVDRIDNPSMYVVFHDSQAYPDYLITFK